jgi:murein DD-endopeptidase MepM/ murein hydrolase activator NlpD
MRREASMLACAAVLAIAPSLASARAAAPERSRPPSAAWTPGAAAVALARVATLGAGALPRLDALCAPEVFELRVPFVDHRLGIELGLRCVADDPAGLLALPQALGLRLELRDIAAGPAGLLARLLLPETPELDFLPDLTALTTSPVPGVESSGFGWRRDPIHHRAKFHRGTDFRAKHGTPVYAAGAGRVVFTGQQHGYGNIVYVDHGGGVVTRYAHLQRFEIQRGALVEAGRLIGRVGSTGRATGPHLHFEVRLGDRAVEPSLAMAIGALERTDPLAARAAAAQLAADVQEQKVDRHDPPGHARKPARRHRGPGRPERAGAPRRVRTVS